MAPLDWVHTATTVVRDNIPRGADGPLDWVQQATKRDLRAGDHVYAWKLGFTYNHHGVVVHTQDCASDCLHDRLECCAIVHFQPPTEDNPGRIEFVSLLDFVQGRGLCRCRYGVPSAEFYMRRSGSCSTHVADTWPLVVIRALSLMDVCCPEYPASDAGVQETAAQVEYNMLKKNSELLACWCMLGGRSGVQRFRSDESAFSPQTQPGRFVRLGLAVAVPVALAAAATAAATGAATTATGAAAVATAGGEAAVATTGAASGTATGSATAATTVGAAAGETVTAVGVASAASAAAAARQMAVSAHGATTAAGQQMLVVGSLAASAAAQNLLLDIAQRPQYATRVLSHMYETTRSLSGSNVAAAQRRSVDQQRRYEEEQQEALVTIFRACLRSLSVDVAKPLDCVLSSAVGCSHLCEVLVDVLEEGGPKEERGCAVLIQSFLTQLSG